MSIKERLVHIMNSEGMNASLFADNIGVQRSSISHILSGRNKPSLDFLEKILGAYPKYNAEWLVMGTGQVYKAPKQSSLFDEPLASRHEILETEQALINSGVNSESFNENTTNDEDAMPYGAQTKSEPVPKAIEKVLIFYNDGTFSDYNPNK